MRLYCISYFDIWQLLCSAEQNNLCNFGSGIMRNNSVKLFEFGPVFHEMSFKDNSYLELWWPFCSAERNHLCNFGRGHYEEQFCDIISNLGQWFRRRCPLKTFLTWGSGGPFVMWNGTI